MKKALSSLLLAVLLSPLAASAFSNPCALLFTPFPESLQISEEATAHYLHKLHDECNLKSQYDVLRDQLRESHQIEFEQITLYQAMRFVERSYYENGKISGTPVEKIYQIKNSDYQLPLTQRSTVIWDNWARGIRQLDESRRRLLNGTPFGIEDLKKVHRGFFTLSDEVGDAAHDPMPGLLKGAVSNDNFWWRFNTDAEGLKAQQDVRQINETFQRLGFLPSSGTSYETDLMEVRSVPRKDSDQAKSDYVIFGGDSRGNYRHLDTLIRFLNQGLRQAQANGHIIQNGIPLTPMEFAYLTQKFYVDLHPFSEGNGRTSRFLQELILTSFDLPLGSSGDLMNIDVLSQFEDYYKTAFTANAKLLKEVEKCAIEYQEKTAVAKVPFRKPQPARRLLDLEPGVLSYDCRILK